MLSSREMRLKKKTIALGCASGLLAFGPAAARAQAAGQLAGVVRDTTGSVLPGVTVTVTGAGLVPPRTVVTDEHGRYVLEPLPAGRYLVTASFRGFEPWSTEIEVGESGRRRSTWCWACPRSPSG